MSLLPGDRRDGAAPERVRVAVLICSTVIGGHEFQAAALVRSLARHVEVKVLVNQTGQRAMFESPGVVVEVAERRLLRPGTLPHQWLDGLRRRRALRAAVAGHDHVIVSAGAVEAGVAAGVALHGAAQLSLYLPFFYDRVPAWGLVAGRLYNAMLARCCRLYSRIITINRIQAKLIHQFTAVSTVVVDNEIRAVAAPATGAPGRLVFVGRLAEQKRVDELLDWLDFADNPFDEMLLIGDGPLRAALEAQAKELTHLSCTFHGWLGPDDQDRLLRGDDVLVMNSLLEGEPLSVREASARGMRVIVRDIVGVRGVTRRHMRYRDRLSLQALLARTPRTQATPVPARLNATQRTRREWQVERLASIWTRP